MSSSSSSSSSASSMADATSNKLHIALFPWLAFGHILPFLRLAKLIARKGHKITFISTPRNIDRLPQTLNPLITFVKLPLPPVDGLPPTAEATSDLAVEQVSHLKRAYDLLQNPLAEFLKSSPRPDWIIFDYVPFWLPPLARELKIPCVFFSIFLASVVSFASPPSGEEEYRKTVEDYMVKPRWVDCRSTVCYRRFESEINFRSISGHGWNQPQPPPPEFYRFQKSLRGCDLIAVRTCPELELEYLQLLERMHGKPVLPIGVLPTDEEDSDPRDWTPIQNWLDRQEIGSVVYAAFGSEAKPTQHEIDEISAGLEQSGLPFFWVLRTQRTPDDPEVLHLPDGFETRTEGRGVVWQGWAPQVKILGHGSVGGFLTHAGWSSAVESLQFGRPLVLLTFNADQGFNAKLLEEKRVGCCLIARDEVDGGFTGEAVAESLRKVVVGEDGRRIREEAGEMRRLFGCGEKHRSYVDEFLSYLDSDTNKKLLQ